MPAPPPYLPCPVRCGALLAWLLTVLLAGTASTPTWAQTAKNELRLVVPAALSRSGLLDRLLPRFQRLSRLRVRVIVLEPPDALTLAGQGQADVLLLSDKERESAAVKAGVVTRRTNIMYGEMVVLGPRSDPAGLRGMTSVVDAVRLIASAEAGFASRADGSAMHRVERGIWEEAGVDVESPTANSWYVMVKGGMRATIKEALRRNAYVITDRGTWLGMRRPPSHVALVADDPRLTVQYAAMLPNPKLHKTVRANHGLRFINFLISKEVQRTINKFAIAGQFPFTANYGERIRK